MCLRACPLNAQVFCVCVSLSDNNSVCFFLGGGGGGGATWGGGS